MKRTIFIFVLCLVVILLHLRNEEAPAGYDQKEAEFGNPNQIESIWTEDCRPDSVILSWVIAECPKGEKKKVRIQRLEIPNRTTGENVRASIITDSLAGPEFRYKDTKVDTRNHYRYKVWVEGCGKCWVSKEVFTVPQPQIEKWGDWPPNPSDRDPVYVNGKRDTVWVDPKSLILRTSDIWDADSIRFRIIMDTVGATSKWQSPSDSLHHIFDLKKKVGDLTPYDGHICQYYVQSKDAKGSTSRWSEAREAIVDVSPPAEVAWLKVTPMINDNATDGWMVINWPQAKDTLSGLDYYRLFRKIGFTGNYEPIADTLRDTCYIDSFSVIDTSTTIYYQLEAIDHVANAGEVGENNARCLLGPTINLPDTVTTDSITVRCEGYDVTDLVGFNVYRNDTLIQIPTTNDSFKIFLREDSLFTHYQIKVQALFQCSGKTLKTTWSNLDTVIKQAMPPDPVNDLEVNTDSTHWGGSDCYPWEGNIYLQWTRPSKKAVKYQIWRWNDSKDSTLVDTLSTDAETIKWIDKYGFDEYNGRAGDTLFVFKYYTYGVKALSRLGLASGISNLDSAYCNRAPKIDTTYFDPPLDLNHWIIKWKPLNVSVDSFYVKCLSDSINGPVHCFHRYRGDKDSAICFVPKKHRYFCFLRAKKNNILTSWSAPDSCDYRLPIIPPTERTLELQPQPGSDTGIFVSWESYWKKTDWDTLPRELVTFFEVCRWKVNAKGDTVSGSGAVRRFYKDSPEWKNASFMDTFKLEPNQKYRYKVIPHQVNAQGLDLTPPPGKCDSKEIINETGRVFIPSIDRSVFAHNPESNFFFFNGDGDTLLAKWGWPDNCHKKGAKIIKIQLSNNRDFVDNPSDQDSTVITHIDTLIDSIVPPISTVFDSLSLSRLNVDPKNGECYYLRITAYDKWTHNHGHYSWEWDGKDSLFIDVTAPDAVRIDGFKTRAVVTKDSGIVEVSLGWKPSRDPLWESGVKGYFVHREILDNSSYIVDTTRWVKTTSCKDTVDISDLWESEMPQYPYRYRLECEDYVGHITLCDEWKWTPITIPRGFHIEKISDIKIRAYWQPVTKAASSILQWWQNTRDPPKPPDTTNSIKLTACDTTFSKSQFTELHYFHVLARDCEGNESGWSRCDSNSKKLVQQDDKDIPEEYELCQNYPNPFNPQTKISYALPEANHVSIKVFNIRGQEVITLTDEFKEAGYHYIFWDGTDSYGNYVASGVYFYQIKAGSYTYTRKCIYFK